MKPGYYVVITSDKGTVDTFSVCDLAETYIVEFGIDTEEITDIKYGFVDIPSYVYAELGVASVNHPTGGSFGVDIFVKNTFAGQVQVIPYHDRNPYRTHYDGLPHWNQEVRLVFPNGEEKLLQRENIKVVKHQIDDAPQITVNLFGIEDAPVSFIINRDDFRERDK